VFLVDMYEASLSRFN